MDIMTAAAKLNIMARMAENQQERESLLLGVEALRRQAGYPPNLPGYCTIEKANRNHLFILNAVIENKNFTNLHAYMSRETMDILAVMTYKGNAIITYSDKNCYENATVLFLGIPVIIGSYNDLLSNIYMVAKVG